VVGMQDLVEKVRDKWAWDILDGTYIHYEMPRSFHFRFRPIAGTDEIKLSIMPENLWTALTLQCVSNCTSGARVRACKACGALFEIGGASGRRSHAEFCSPKCRFDFSYRNRKRRKK
jgi:hypothetical protein